MIAACLLCLAITIPAFAANAEVYTDVVHACGEIVTVPLSIRGNPGLMGLKLIVTYDGAVLQPQAVTRGTVTQSGMIQDSIGVGEVGTLLIVWSDTDAVKADGTLAVLTFKAQQQNDTTLTVSYSQPDTFDGGFADVKLDCKPIEIVFDGKTQTTPPVTKIPDSRDIQAAVDSVDDKTDVSAVNEAVARLTGTEDYYATPEEVQSSYSTAVADIFVETLHAVDGEKINAVIQSALQEVGAETVESVPPDKQEAFVQSVETALQEVAPDVPAISNTLTAKDAVQVIKTLQTHTQKLTENRSETENPTKSINWPLPFVFAVCVITIIVLLVFFCLRKSRKNKEDSEDEI